MSFISKKFLETPQERAERIAYARQVRRAAVTPAHELPGKVEDLFQFCLQQLPEAFGNNRVALEAYVEVPHVIRADVLEGLRNRFPGWKVEYTFSDTITYDHLGFTPPEDWILRLL